MMHIHLLVLLFFPKWPAVMQTWIHTACHSNPNVTFSLITDLDFTHPSWEEEMYNMTVPSNLKLIKMTFNEFVIRANERLGLGNVNIVKQYKLCDFMPTLGVMFAPELRGYTHWGWSDIDTVLGNIRDIYEVQEQGEDILHFHPSYYFNVLSIIRNSNFATNLYKAVPKQLLDRVFHLSPNRALAFDEDLLTCQMMKQDQVTARLFPNTDCGKVKAWWWYQGKFFHLGGKCLLTHFGGGSRGQAAEKKANFISGINPFFEEGYYLNNTVGFGYMRKLFYYFVVNEETLDITIFEMQEPANGVWRGATKTKLAYLFKNSYKLSYPSPSSSSSGSSSSSSIGSSSSSSGGSDVREESRRRDAYIAATSASASVFRRGNASDHSHWTKHCHTMVDVAVEHVVKTPANDAPLL